MLNSVDQFEHVNFGCGAWIANDYLNIDFLDYMFGQTLDCNIAYHLPNIGSNCYFLKHDVVANGVPLPDNQFNVVYHSHFLEHLNNVEGFKFLQECFRIMKPGATMRILVPDLELWADAYFNNRQSFLEQYKTAWLKDPTLYRTKGQIFMGALHNHEHKMGYDFETLKWLLESIGFNSVIKTAYAQSNIPQISYLEQPNPRQIESLCLECVKPLS